MSVGKLSPRPARWEGSSLDDLSEQPKAVRKVFGYAIWLAEQGDKHPDAKPLKGFSGAGVFEVVEDYDGDTYRAVYTIRFPEAVYVLHVFQKKSKKGIATPKAVMKLIKQRLAAIQKRNARQKEEPSHGEKEDTGRVHSGKR